MQSEEVARLEEVASLGRAMSIYWCLVEHVDPSRLRKYKSKPLSDREGIGLFYSKSLGDSSLNLDMASSEWTELLKAIIQISVEPRRTDIEKALGRFDVDGNLWHPDENNDLSKRMQSQGIKMMISHIATKKRNYDLF